MGSFVGSSGVIISSHEIKIKNRNGSKVFLIKT